MWLNPGAPASWSLLALGAYGQATAAGFQSYYDDVYIDNTLARVEIGDAPDYASATHREIQIPSSWSDGHIEATLHLGSFPATAGLYLYVVDAEGRVSPGFPL
jgi:hypothetical protein